MLTDSILKIALVPNKHIAVSILMILRIALHCFPCEPAANPGANVSCSIVWKASGSMREAAMEYGRRHPTDALGNHPGQNDAFLLNNSHTRS